MKARISKRSVDALVCPPDKDRVILWDGAIPGFGVIVFPTGAKVYVIQYRVAWKSRRIKIGRHGHLTPEQARTEAKKLLGQIASGKNPAGDRKAARDVRIFESVAIDFMERHIRAKGRSPRTIAEFERILGHNINPAIGKKRLSEIIRHDIAELHHSLRGKPYLANKCLAIISSVWNWSDFDGKNPTRKIERFPEDPRERPISDDEAARLWNAINAAQTKHPWPVVAFKLYLFTGAGHSQILNMKWDHVDLKRRIVTLPWDTIGNKSGQNRRPKIIRLNSFAADVIAALPRLGTYVILGQKPDKPRSHLTAQWHKICQAAGVTNVRIHDLRHFFVSQGTSGGMGLPVLAGLVGHAQTTTTAGYSHPAQDAQIEAAETIGRAISNKLNRKPPADVVELKRNPK